MLKIDIPSAASMADIAEKKKADFETTVMKGPVFRDILNRIENAAFEGKTFVSVAVQGVEQRQALNVISKYLIAAGYELVKTFQHNLISEISISWRLGKTPERR